MILVLARVPADLSETVSKEIVKRKLALSVSIISSLTFEQNGKVHNDCILMIKTRKELFERVSKVIKEYVNNVSEVLALKVVEADIDYLHLLESATSLKKIRQAENERRA